MEAEEAVPAEVSSDTTTTDPFAEEDLDKLALVDNRVVTLEVVDLLKSKSLLLRELSYPPKPSANLRLETSMRRQSLMMI